MNARKFYLTLSSIVLFFLFAAGIVLLGYINNSSAGDFFASDIMKDFFSSTNPVNVLVLGGDKVNGNTDTMMIVNYNPKTANISVLSIPRDTKVKIDGSTHKINFAYPHGGIKQAVSAINDLIDININYYVYVDTSVFRDVIDELGGVDIYIPANMDYDDDIQKLHIHLKKGQRHLNGREAEGYMRFRHPNYYKKSDKELRKYYDGSDIKRIDAQQNFIKELIRQKANILYLPKFNKILDMVFDRIETNVTLNEALKMSNNITQIKADNVTTFKLLGEDKKTSGSWYYVYNNKILNNNTKEVLNADAVISEFFKADESFSEFSNGGSKSRDTEKESNTRKGSSKTKNTVKRSVTKKNPSNTESSIKGTKKPEP
ncbi:MAG: LCP family protein [Clostridia bacterium]|nr:LCP family protein [Clostridia bacterium]